jgi:hypothetical protein
MPAEVVRQMQRLRGKGGIFTMSRFNSESSPGRTLLWLSIAGLALAIGNFDPDAYERRFIKLENSDDARLAEARKKSDGAARVAAAHLRVEFGRRHGDVEARLARLENDWQADRWQLASLQGELSPVRRQFANQESRMMAGEHNSSQDRAIVEQTLDQRIAEVRREIVGNQRELDKLARGIALRRVDFEVSKNQD